MKKLHEEPSSQDSWPSVGMCLELSGICLRSKEIPGYFRNMSMQIVLLALCNQLLNRSNIQEMVPLLWDEDLASCANVAKEYGTGKLIACIRQR